MRYFAKGLRSVYGVLETLPKPLAILDFLCGEVGREFVVAQSLGGQFYDEHRKSAHVVALCWEGASLLYINVSDDQIEFTNRVRSRSGDKRHDGGRKIHWLTLENHKEHIGGIEGIVAHCGPLNISAKAIIQRYGLRSGKQWKMVKDRLVRTGFVFPARERLVDEPYIALFDRTEKHRPERNTQQWQINLFRQWAREFGLRLAVISGFYPRSQGSDVVRFSFRHRDFDLLCNVIRHSVLYASPPSGASNAGIVFGCNFVMLQGAHTERNKDIMSSLLSGRGFQHFGILTDSHCETANKIREYLKELKCFL